jgi:hypothetical protein
VANCAPFCPSSVFSLAGSGSHPNQPGPAEFEDFAPAHAEVVGDDQNTLLMMGQFVTKPNGLFMFPGSRPWFPEVNPRAAPSPEPLRVMKKVIGFWANSS